MTDLEDEKKQVWQEVGRAMAVWSDLELALAMLFSKLVSGLDGNATAVAAFYAIENFRNKLQAIDAMLTASHLAPLSPEWQKLRERIGNCQRRRNRFAHHDLLVNSEGKPGRRVGLIPPLLGAQTAPKLVAGDLQPLFLSELGEGIASMAAAAEAIKAFNLRTGPAATPFGLQHLANRFAAQRKADATAPPGSSQADAPPTPSE